MMDTKNYFINITKISKCWENTFPKVLYVFFFFGKSSILMCTVNFQEGDIMYYILVLSCYFALKPYLN